MKDGRAFFSGKKIKFIQIIFGLFLIMIMIYPSLYLFVFPTDDVKYVARPEADHFRYMRNVAEYIRWIGFDRLDITDNISLKDYIESLDDGGLSQQNRLDLKSSTSIEVIPVSEELKKVYVVDEELRKEIYIYQG